MIRFILFFSRITLFIYFFLSFSSMIMRGVNDVHPLWWDSRGPCNMFVLRQRKRPAHKAMADVGQTYGCCLQSNLNKQMGNTKAMLTREKYVDLRTMARWDVLWCEINVIIASQKLWISSFSSVFVVAVRKSIMPWIRSILFMLKIGLIIISRLILLSYLCLIFFI